MLSKLLPEGAIPAAASLATTHASGGSSGITSAIRAARLAGQPELCEP
jgi:hypothetical protein